MPTSTSISLQIRLTVDFDTPDSHPTLDHRQHAGLSVTTRRLAEGAETDESSLVSPWNGRAPERSSPLVEALSATVVADE